MNWDNDMLYNDMMHVEHAIQTQYEQHVVWLISRLLHELRLSQWSMRHAKITTKTFILVKEKCCFEHFLFDVYLLGSIHTELSDSIAEN